MVACSSPCSIRLQPTDLVSKTDASLELRQRNAEVETVNPTFSSVEAVSNRDAAAW